MAALLADAFDVAAVAADCVGDTDAADFGLPVSIVTYLRLSCQASTVTERLRPVDSSEAAAWLGHE